MQARVCAPLLNDPCVAAIPSFRGPCRRAATYMRESAQNISSQADMQHRMIWNRLHTQYFSLKGFRSWGGLVR